MCISSYACIGRNGAGKRTDHSVAELDINIFIIN